MVEDTYCFTQCFEYVWLDSLLICLYCRNILEGSSVCSLTNFRLSAVLMMTQSSSGTSWMCQCQKAHDPLPEPTPTSPSESPSQWPLVFSSLLQALVGSAEDKPDSDRGKLTLGGSALLLNSLRFVVLLTQVNGQLWLPSGGGHDDWTGFVLVRLMWWVGSDEVAPLCPGQQPKCIWNPRPGPTSSEMSVFSVQGPLLTASHAVCTCP